MKTVLAPLDFSPSSAGVLDEAIALARSITARLVILHVVQPPSVADPGLEVPSSADLVVVSSEAAEKHLASLQRELVARGVTVETRQVTGLPGQRIVEMVTAMQVEYVVLGSHGHGALYDLIVGSTTTRVLRDASCPVVVVPRGRKTPRR